jgi:hypothetical protein
MSDVPHGSKVAYHVRDGAFVFPHALDAHSAVTRHPKEWSWEPWSVAARRVAGHEVEPLIHPEI